MSVWKISRPTKRPTAPFSAAEKVGPDRRAVAPTLVPLGADAGEAGLVGKQWELDRLGHELAHASGREAVKTVSSGDESSQREAVGTPENSDF